MRARFAPSAMRKRVGIGYERGLARQPMAGRDAGHALHDEEIAAEDGAVAAKEQRLPAR